jgi:tetratricopeptide (TPR) repeat protein
LKNPKEKGEFGSILVVNKAAALNNMGRYSEAIKSLEEVKVQCDKVHKNLGDAYYNIEMLDKAIYHYEKAIKLNAKLDEAYFNLAVILYRQGSHFNAKMNIEKAISLNSNDTAYI